MDTILTLTCPHRHTSQPKPREGVPFRRESPARAEPSLVEAWGYPPSPVRSASLPVGESSEGGALFGGGSGEPPNPYSLRFPSGGRVQRGRALFGGGLGNPPTPSAPLPFRRESPERPSPLWWGLGEPPTPIRSASLPVGEPGEGRALFGGGSGEPSNPYSLRFPSGGRVQRGRSPLWWGFGGTPQPLFAPLPAREVGGRPERGGALLLLTYAPPRCHIGA